MTGCVNHTRDFVSCSRSIDSTCISDDCRGADKQKNFLKGITAATNFTHHQVHHCGC